MNNHNDQQIDVLNSLVSTTLDSADGYLQAAKATKNLRFKTLFDRRALERKQLTGQLQTEIRNLGGVPATDGTILASATRMFVNLKNMVSDSDQTIVNVVESGEDSIKAKYESALKESCLSSPVKSVISSAYLIIKTGHDQMSNLKHELQAQPTH